MKRESNKIKCYVCGKVIGKKVPTGIYEHGIPRTRTVLKDNGVNILSLSLADTTEYGLLRLIVNDPETGRKKLAESGFSTMLTDILIIKITHKSGSLQGLIQILSEKDVNVEYMYGLSIDGEKAFVVLKASDLNDAKKVLEDCGVETLTANEISNF